MTYLLKVLRSRLKMFYLIGLFCLAHYLAIVLKYAAVCPDCKRTQKAAEIVEKCFVGTDSTLLGQFHGMLLQKRDFGVRQVSKSLNTGLSFRW